LYIVWQNTFSKQKHDILLALDNNQKDKNHTKILNLSNNTSISECPSIAISNNNVYVIWEDLLNVTMKYYLQIFLLRYSLTKQSPF
jgi:hypothetical protein